MRPKKQLTADKLMDKMLNDEIQKQVARRLKPRCAKDIRDEWEGWKITVNFKRSAP